MVKIDYEVHCLRCGHILRGRRREDEHKKSFECKKCCGQFSITFEHPTREELQDAFIAGELRPNIILRPSAPVEQGFPSAIFENFMKRR